MSEWTLNVSSDFDMHSEDLQSGICSMLEHCDGMVFCAFQAYSKDFVEAFHHWAQFITSYKFVL